MTDLNLSPRAGLALPLCPDLAPHTRLALVTRVERGAIAVIDDAGVAGAAAVTTTDIAVGDHVVIDDADAVVEVRPRRSALWRAREHGSAQLLAANVDVVLCVVGADQGLRPRRLERALALAWESGAEPVVVITKTDLVDETEHAGLVWQTERLAPGCAVVSTSTRPDAPGFVGIGALRALLVTTSTAGDPTSRVAVMLGVSGAGKSALTNALLGAAVIPEGALSADGLRGAHTTTTRSVHLLPGGGVVIDTPGLRAFAVATSDEALAAAFADIEALAPSCRFRDCAHDGEPGCAVVGVVSADRVAAYCRLQREAERHRARDQGGYAVAERRRAERAFSRLTSEAAANRRRRRGED